MSIASELNRLLQAKSDLATAIANKGETVPANATMDDYAALVDSIKRMIRILEAGDMDSFSACAKTTASKYTIQRNCEEVFSVFEKLFL